MSHFSRQIVPWIGLYIAMVVLPLALVLVGPLQPGRGFWIEFSIAIGFVGLAMMGVQFALTARFRSIASMVGMDAMLNFHRQAGIVAAVFVFAHPIIAILADRQYLAFFDPRENLPRTAALSFVSVALLLVIALPLCRKAIGLSYEWWRLTHGILAGFVVLIGLAHVLMVSHYVNAPWKQGMWILLIGASLGFFINTRLIKPWLSRRKAWRVAGVMSENEDVITLTLEPEGDHELRFLPGQCIWLTLGETPFTLQQHPFTICSSAEQTRRISFTIKSLGDYTRSLLDAKPGMRAFLEGPYGTFTVAVASTSPIVLILGGIGITPGMSILRTLRDRRAPRKIRLLYANVTEEQILFREELDAMKDALDLEIVYVLDEPPAQWPGEAGYVDGAMLERTLGELIGRADVHYYVCGPESMMDNVERALLDRGVRVWQIHSERFNIV